MWGEGGQGEGKGERTGRGETRERGTGGRERAGRASWYLPVDAEAWLAWRIKVTAGLVAPEASPLGVQMAVSSRDLHFQFY